MYEVLDEAELDEAPGEVGLDEVLDEAVHDEDLDEGHTDGVHESQMGSAARLTLDCLEAVVVEVESGCWRSWWRRSGRGWGSRCC